MNASAASTPELDDLDERTGEGASPSPTLDGGQPGGPVLPPKPAPTVTYSAYDQILDEQDQKQRLQQSGVAASLRPDPTRWSKVLRLAQQMNLPPNVVDRNFDQVQSGANAQATNYDQIIQQSPGLAQWLEHPDNATLAKGEHAPLARVGAGASVLARYAEAEAAAYGLSPLAADVVSPAMTGAATGLSDLQVAGGHLAAAFGMADPDNAAAFVARASARAAAMREGAPGDAQDYSAAVDRALRDYKSGAIGSTAAVLDVFGAALHHPTGALYGVGEGAFGSLPALVGGALGSRLGRKGLAAGTFLGMAPVAIGQAVGAELQRRGVDVNDPDALAAAYRDPDVMSHIRSLALRQGLTTAGVSALVASVAGSLTGRAEAAGAGTVATTAAKLGDVGVQAVGQGAADAAGQLAGTGTVNVAQSAQTAISMLFQEGVTASLGARSLHSPDQVTAARDVAARTADALRAQHDAVALDEIGQGLRDAPNTASVPDRVKQLVDVASGGDAATHVYFQTDDWDRYWTDRGRSPAQAAAQLMGDGGQGYDEARATGAPMAIGLGDYVSRIASEPEHFDGLLPIARTVPGGASLAEAESYLQTVPGTIRDLANEAAQAPTEAPDTPAVDKLGRAQLREQLTGAGRSTSEAAAASQLHAAAFGRLAERAGLTPEELTARYPLAVSAAGEPATVDPEALHQSLVALVGPAHAAAMRANLSDSGFATGTDASSVRVPFGQRVDGTDDTVTVMRRAIARVGRDEFQRQASANLEARGAEDVTAQQAAIEETARTIVAAHPLAEFQQSTRGRIRFGETDVEGRTPVAIDLFGAADRSTFLHESAHLYMRVLDDMASGKHGSASDELMADHAAVREWLGAKDGEPLTRDQHEQFARGFEAYLMEGKAPSEALRGVFVRFKTWLLGVYRDARALGVNLTDPMRGVFARLLASHDEIRQAEPAVRPLFDDPKAAGFTDEQAAKYRATVAEHRQAAEEALTACMMHEIRREQSAEWKQWRAPIEARTTSEVDAEPLYRALAFLRKGTNPDGSPLAEGTAPFKLSKAETTAILGADATNALPRDLFGADGVPPDVAADLFGFSTGRELLEAIATSPDRDGAIATRTDAAMHQQHGERMSDADVHAAALRAVLNDKQDQVLRLELRHLASDDFATFKGLARGLAKRIPPSDAVRAEAGRLVGSKKMAEIRPYLLELAVRRASTDAREALYRGDIEGAFQAKRRELLATAVYRAAVDAKEIESAALNEFKRAFRPDAVIGKTRDVSTVNAARAILSTFGIGHSDRPALEYMKQMGAYEPDTYAALEPMVAEATANAQRAGGNWRNLTFDQFRDLRETVDALWTVARSAREIEIDGVKMEKDAVVEQLAQRADALAKPEPKAGYRQAMTEWDKAKVGMMGVRAALRRVEHWVRAMDAGKDDGVFRRYVWNPIVESATAFRGAKRDVMAKYAAIAKPLDGLLTDDEIAAPELNYTFKGHPELLGAMLHSGNDSNLSKLLRGRGWGQFTETGALDRSRWDAFVSRMQREGTLTKAHYDYLQHVWNLFDSLKPDAQKAHRAMYGYYFNEITANPFTTPYGRYEGGYVPAKANPFMASDAAVHGEREAIENGNNSYMFPTTGRGFTKSRVEAYAKPLLMDAYLVPTHIDAALRFIHLEPHVKDVARVLLDRRMVDALDAVDQTARGDMLIPYLQRAARQTIETPIAGHGGRFAANSARFLRARAGMQLMALNLTVAAEQLTHFPTVMTRVHPSSLAGGLWRYLTAPRDLVSSIHEASPYMATRESAGLMEVRKSIDNIMLDKSRMRTASDWLVEHGSFLARAIQHVMDHATWSGAYSEAMERDGMSPTAAVRHADATVRETLGAYEPESLSRFETSNAVVRSLSMFYSFYNNKANLLGSEYASTMRAMGLRKGAGRLATVYALGVALPAMLGYMVKQQLSGASQDDADEGAWDQALHAFLGSQAEAAARMLPVAGPAALAAVEFMKHKRVDLLSSPAIHLLESAVASPAAVYHSIEGNMTRSDVQDVFNLLGMLSGMPLAPLAKPVTYLHAVHTHAIPHPSGPADVVRGVLTGASK